jgi:hypothetical protein
MEPVSSRELSFTNRISSSEDVFSSKTFIAPERNFSPFLMGMRRVIGGDLTMLK